MRVVSAGLVFVAVVMLTTLWGFHRNLVNGIRWTCEIVHEAYYKKSEDLNEWRNSCLKSAKRLYLGSNKKDAVRLLNENLSEIGTSHLQIYSPEKSDEMWENRAIDNGLRTRVIDGSFIITGIIEGSAASEYDLRLGDEIVAINEKPPVSAYELRFSSGEFEFKRNESENFVAVILAENLVESLNPSFRKLDASAGILEIKSFLPQYFKKEEWLKIVKDFSSTSKLIIDLRGNSGGNFVSMLRALSPFFCEPTSVGIVSTKIENGKSDIWTQKILEDDLESQTQIDQLEKEESLFLKTYAGYGCSRATRVIALVDAETASTAEIFAYALSRRQNSKVWGVPTAGQVVVARWYDLSAIGFGGYSISVPVAGFTSLEGLELEAEGIMPTRLLFYDLDRARQGIDNWITEAR